MNIRATVGIIGGSGLYDLPGLTEAREHVVSTPFGAPSDAVLVGKFGDISVAFLPRHGRGHRLLPSEVPARANLWALKSLGVRRVIGVGACGSLREDLAPRHFVLPDQVFDKTTARPSTFFGDGAVAHVSLDRPFCPDLTSILFQAAGTAGVTVHRGGTYVCMEGPAFSTKAESHAHRSMGFDIVGMTLSPEHKLAREAQLCYATVSLVTDYDVWKEGHEVSVETLVEVLQANINTVKKVIAQALGSLGAPRACPCGSSLAHAVFTAQDTLSPAARERLAFLRQ